MSKFTCDICNFSTESQNNIARHYQAQCHKIKAERKKQKEDTNEQCNICGMVFTDKNELSKHISLNSCKNVKTVNINTEEKIVKMKRELKKEILEEIQTKLESLVQEAIESGNLKNNNKTKNITIQELNIVDKYPKPFEIYMNGVCEYLDKNLSDD